MSSEADPLGLIGTTIAEKYAMESIVGEGGFAVVYRANHVVWKRPVAVKVFKALGEVAPAERQKLLDDFIQEGRLLADLSERSTAICQARDVGMLKTPRGDQVPYMVLEWLEGKPLENVLADERAAQRPLRSLDETIRLLDPVAEALALAHKKGIAHRDVKPANVFVLGYPRDARGEEMGVKLLDFGIAKVVQDAQKMGFGKTAGHITSFTPSYGAPEQFNRAYGATGPWTDVFALALVTVEVLSGEEPLAGDSLVQLAYAASDPERRPVPRTFGVATTDEVDAIFRRAVAVQTADRYQTVGEFWNALRTVATGHPMSAHVTAHSRSSIEALGVSQTVANPTPSGGIAAPFGTAARASVPGSGSAPFAMMPPPVSGPTPSGPARGSAGPLVAVAAVIAVVVVGIGATLALRSNGAKPAMSASSAVVPPAASLAPTATSSVRPTASAAPVAGTCPPGMKKIDGGEFFMGSDEKDADDNEKPPHKVKLSPYCLDEFEVTMSKYKACSNRGGCLRAGRENVWSGITAQQRKIYDPLCNANAAAERGEHPVNCVDWEQASKYCEAVDGRLPTEAEWEFAARGSDGRVYPWGDEKPSAQLLNACGTECLAWMKANPDPEQPLLAMYEEDDGWPATAPVGRFPKGASGRGIQDIVGNVWEWVADWHAPYDPAAAATTVANPKGAPTGTQRVIRGGSWNGAKPAWVRPSWRFQVDPKMRTHGIGFRCARSL